MKVYLSGPMTGFPEFNYPAFRSAAAALRAEGFEVVSPAGQDEQSGLVPGKDGWEDFVRHDLRVMLDCEGIVLMDGWFRSRGARLEHHVAVELGFETLTLAEALNRLVGD